MKHAADRLHRFTLALSIALFGVMFAAQLAVVLMRYVMGVGFLEVQDAVTYSFSALVVLSIPLALREGRHVRVDILRGRFSARTNAGLDRLGHALFTLPVFGLMLWNAWPLVAASWSILEGSRETGGLPGLFAVKSTLVAMCVLVLLRAVIDLVDGEPGDQPGGGPGGGPGRGAEEARNDD